jgi:CubicO group peptidase (beta-lactamase class C family)
MNLLAHAVDSIADASGFAGVVRVDRDDDVELAKAYGLAHRGHEISNTVDTQFAIASGTKGFTAVAVASLIEDCCRTGRASVTTWMRTPVSTSPTT